jgi:hypothetical protein
MKLSDVDKKINEGLGDWLVQRQATKLGAQKKAADDRVFKVGLQYFKNQLNQSLQSGIKSGFIEPPKKLSANAANAASSTVKSVSDVSDTSSATKQQRSADTNANASVQVQPGQRIVIPKVGALQYYKLSNGKWYNANNQEITRKTAIQNLEQQAETTGRAREENIPPANKQKTSESRKFTLLSQLIENKILNEQETVSGFIQDYVASQTDEFGPNPKYTDFINRLSNTAQNEYAETGEISDKTYEQLWSTIFNWSKLSRRGSGRGSVKSSRNDSIDTDTDKDGVPDKAQRREWLNKTVDTLDKIDPSDSTGVKEIGKIGKQLYNFAKQSGQA